jgi:hypothetical protein
LEKKKFWFSNPFFIPAYLRIKILGSISVFFWQSLYPYCGQHKKTPATVETLRAFCIGRIDRLIFTCRDIGSFGPM